MPSLALPMRIKPTAATVIKHTATAPKKEEYSGHHCI
jgi:hypothetical protein